MLRCLLWGLYLGVVALWGLAFLHGAVAPVTVFDGPLWDGPFQHFNALRRIHAGQTGGVDFQFFHGLGVPYLHYPLFRLLGGDIYASETTRYLLNLVAYVAPYPVVFLAATRRAGAALGLTAVAHVLSEPLGLHFLAWPSHNTPGVRAAVPLLVLGVFLAGFRPRREALTAGVLTGLAFVLGTEHGLATALMLAVTWVARRVSGRPEGVKELAIAAACAIGTAGGCLLAVGGARGALTALRYAFVDIPADQFWYFGTPSLPFLGSWAEVFDDRRMLLAYGAAATQAAVLLLWARRSATGQMVGPPLIGGLAYGVMASVGYLSYTGYQFHLPLIRVELIVALVVVWRAVEKLQGAEPGRYGPAVRALQLGFAAAVLLAGPLPAYGPSSVVRLPALVHSVSDAWRALDGGGCRLSEPLAAHLDQVVRAIDANRTRPGPPTIWSEYAGLVEAHYGVFHPTHDYIIHARGRTGSADYLAAFRAADPEFAFTFHRGYWPHEDKHQAADWGFYEELFRNYAPVVRTAYGHLWRRLPGGWHTAPDEGWVDVPSAPEGFVLPPAAGANEADRVVVVEVGYTVHRPTLRFLPIVGETPRYLLYPFDARNTLPVPARPYADRMTFPVVAEPGKQARFFPGVRSLVGGWWEVTRVRVRPLAPAGAARYLDTLR